MSKRFIFLRGLTRAAFHWGDFQLIFRSTHPDYEVEFLEIPGNGILHNTDTPIDPVEAIRQLSLQSQFVKEGLSFHLCGISLGGMLALKWAELNPQQVESVTTINCSLAQFSPFYQRLNPDLYLRVFKALFSKGVFQKEQSILDITSNRKENHGKYLGPFTNFSKHHKIKRKNFIRQLILANKIHIENLKIPLKVICSEGDRLCSPNCSKAIAHHLHGQLAIHPDAGHDLPLDEPHWLADQF